MFSSNASQVSSSANYIEDFFSAWLRTGTGSSQTVTTGIEEDTGALVISKSRSAATDWAWYDTFRGATKDLVSNSTAAQTTQSQGLTSFNSNGHTWGTLAKVNTSGATYVDFVLKPQPKFFDIVTYTGNGATNRVIPHNLGSVPGMIITKRIADSSNWGIYHRSLGLQSYILLNTAAAAVSTTQGTDIASVSATDYVLYPPNRDIGYTANASGETYVAYLFAHNAGGFGLSGEDNVISCGSFTRTFGTANSVNLGYEPQWVLIKCTSQTDSWQLYDTMRGLSQTASLKLEPNSANSESNTAGMIPTATGFDIDATGVGGGTYIYIAIRRGPMKVPESGTSVFSPVARAGTSADATVSAGFPPDSLLVKNRGGSSSSVDWSFNFFDKLRSFGYRLSTAFTDAEDTSVNFITSFDQNGVTLPGTGYTATNGSGYNYINYFFRRAPGFFDEVCYKGSSAARTVAHNLTVAPELMIVKQRSSTTGWVVYSSALAASDYLVLNNTSASQTASTIWNSTAPTASVFSVGTSTTTNTSGGTYVAYLFASCPGVSKCGSFTGNGSSQTINCGFTAGARFVLVKATSTTGDWLVADSARGIVSGNDPYLELNTTNAEVTGEDWLDTDSSGFVVNEVAGSNANTNGVTYIYLAIA